MGKFKGKPKSAPRKEAEKPRYEKRAEFSDDSEDVFSEDDLEDEENEEAMAEEMLPAADGDEDEEDDDNADEGEEEEEGGNIRWGSKRSDFYKRDTDSDDEEGEDFDNEQEALRLKKKRQSKIKDEDLELGADDDEDDEENGAKVVVRRSLKGADDDETLAAEAPEILALLGEFSEKASEARDSVLPILNRLKSQAESATKEGVAYLETKVHLLLSYTLNVAFFLMYRAENGAARAEAHPVVDKLVKLRTLLEKLRPLDLKLKNELDELVRRALVDENEEEQQPARARGSSSSKGEGSIRANVADLEGDHDEEDEDEGNGDENEEEEMEGEEDKDPKERRKREREQRRLLARAEKSPFVRDLLRGDDEDAPEEMVDDLRAASRQSKYEEEKRKFEEENFVRLRENKKARAKKAHEEKRAAVHGGDMNTLLREIDQNEYAKFKDLLDDDATPMSFGRSRGGEDDDEEQQSDDNEPGGRPANLSRHLNEMTQARKTSKSQFQGGDDDVLPTKRQRVSRPTQQSGDDDDHGNAAPHQEVEVDAGEEHPFYNQSVSRRKQASKERDESYQFPKRFAPDPVRLVEAGESRFASKSMLRNRGLTAHRRKDLKNPRSKMREKFEGKVKARRGQVRDVRTGEGNYYQGESSGIRSNVVRSRQAGKI